MKVAILNTSILTNDGEYKMTTCTLEYAKKQITSNLGFISAIGHESTAAVLTELIGIEIPENRIMFAQEVEQTAIVFKLNGRPPEGVVLTKEEIEKIGYSFKLLYRRA